jgi:hypothetical protein
MISSLMPTPKKFVNPNKDLVKKTESVKFFYKRPHTYQVRDFHKPKVQEHIPLKNTIKIAMVAQEEPTDLSKKIKLALSQVKNSD